jgi:hypothetical protein
MTIVIAFHASGYRDFKHFYLMLLARHSADFPGGCMSAFARALATWKTSIGDLA